MPASTRLEAARLRVAIGLNVRTLRLAADVKQTGLARELEVAGLKIKQQAIDRIERGLRSLRVEEAIQIAVVLDVHPSHLLEVNPERLAALEKLVRARVAIRRLRAQAAELVQQQDETAKAVELAEAQEREASSLLEFLESTVVQPQLPGLS